MTNISVLHLFVGNGLFCNNSKVNWSEEMEPLLKKEVWPQRRAKGRVGGFL